jgi:hypothetical protein
MVSRKQREKEREKRVKAQDNLQNMPPMNYFLQLGTTSHQVPIIPSNYEFTNGLTH